MGVHMTMMQVILFLALFAFASSEFAEQSESLANCGTGPACRAGYFCKDCLDGSSACFSTISGTCCGCTIGGCWACPYRSSCRTSQPNYCPANSDPVATIASCVVVVFVLIFIFGIAGWRRYNYGYWGWNSEPTVVVTHYNDTTYGYDSGHHHHHHNHHATYPASQGYQTGSSAGYPASQGYQTGSSAGYPASGGYQTGSSAGYPASGGYQVS